MALTVILTVGIGASASWLGTAADVLSKECVLIKTGLKGQKLAFTDSDFKSALAVTDIGRITVVSLPSEDEGVLYLGEKRAAEGQAVKRRNISDLYFLPADEGVTESSFTFKLSGGSEAVCTCKMRFTDKVNYAPKINTDTEKTLSVTTQKGISVFGKISAYDPEGDATEVMILSYPKGGSLTLDGFEFKYTPTDGFTGKDSFVFVLRDEYGNYSEPKEVNVKISERLSEAVYVDMLESKSYNAAIAVTAMGLMGGTIVGDDSYFLPEGSVTRAEFCAMAMKALSVRADSTLTSTFFDDGDEIPPSLVGYVATAARCGIVNGSFEGDKLLFRPNDAITLTEAAIIMSNLLSIKSTDAVFSELDGIDTVPVYARAEVGAMFELGVFDSDTAKDLSAPITREMAAECLYRLMK